MTSAAFLRAYIQEMSACRKVLKALITPQLTHVLTQLVRAQRRQGRKTDTMASHDASTGRRKQQQQKRKQKKAQSQRSGGVGGDDSDDEDERMGDDEDERMGSDGDTCDSDDDSVQYGRSTNDEEDAVDCSSDDVADTAYVKAGGVLSFLYM